MNSPYLTISIQLITEYFENALKSADQPKPAFNIDRNRKKYSLTTSVHMPSGKNKLERDFQMSKHHLISQNENYEDILSFLVFFENWFNFTKWWHDALKEHPDNKIFVLKYETLVKVSTLENKMESRFFIYSYQYVLVPTLKHLCEYFTL